MAVLNPGRCKTGTGMLEVQALYDTFFDDSPAWRQARGGHRPDP